MPDLAGALRQWPSEIRVGSGVARVEGRQIVATMVGSLVAQKRTGSLLESKNKNIW